MGCCGGNKTHPEGKDSPDFGYDYEYDQRYDYDSGYHNKKDYGPSYKNDTLGPRPQKRSCTDILCLLLFIAFLAGWGVVAVLGFLSGDISKVIYPTDSEGNICGRGERQDRPFLLMFDLTRCLNPAVVVTGCLTEHVCVEKCPDMYYSPLGESLKPGADVEGIKKMMEPYCKPIFSANPEIRQKTIKELVSQEICPAWVLKSTSLLGRCFPFTVSSSNATVVNPEDTLNGTTAVSNGQLKTALTRMSAFLNLRELGERVFSDLRETYWMIGLGLLGSCILSFVWIVLMRFIAGCMIWTSIAVLFFGFGGLLAFSSYKLYFAQISTDPAAHQTFFEINFTPYIVDDFLAQRDTWLAFTVILGIIFLVLTCLFIFLRQRILIAIALIEQGSKAVGQMFSSLFFPIIPFLLQLVVVGWFLLIALHLSSSGTPEYRVAIRNNETYMACAAANPANCTNPANSTNTGNDVGIDHRYRMNDTCSPTQFQSCASACPGAAACQFVKYEKSSDISWQQFVNLFGLYWGVFFCTAFGEMVLAGVFATWYWTEDKNHLPGCVLGTSMWNATVYHLGTVAFGSLIISIIRMIRTIVEYIEKKTKRWNNNDLAKCVICFCKCCLWCLEKFMRFINRNAYIMCAVKGTNFCKSAAAAFNLIMRNLVRVVVLDSVVDFLLFLGKLLITIVSGSVSYLVFAGYFPEIIGEIATLNYFYTPVACIVVGSYFIASSFFGVYGMAVDTLFLCFLEDLERNDGSVERPYLMSTRLRKILGKMQQTAEESRYSMHPM